MARISELHYSNAYANSSGISEFLEVSLDASDDPANYTVSFYQANGTVGVEVSLDDPSVQVTVDPETGELNYVISADHFDILLTDPDGGSSGNYEAYALTNTDTGTVIDFYDIGGGTQNITATNGVAAGATSQNLAVLVGPNSTTTSLQFNQPNPDELTYETVSPGDTGIACFAAATLIDTPTGPRRIGELRLGDMVCTQDDGPQAVRWVGRSTVRGQRRYVPVRISAGVFGATEDVLVSPQHRVLVTGWQAELYYGESEVLVPAHALVNGTTVSRVPCDIITYVHVMFDRHQLICSSGLISESFLPGGEAVNGLTAASAEELFGLFPELRDHPETYGLGVRSIRTATEGALISAV
mgnify:CR=1 FL=1